MLSTKCIDLHNYGMSNIHSERAIDLINRISYITIATAGSDGHPWNTPVYSAFDSDLNFYWFSDKNAQHSKNLRENKNVFLVIYDSTVPEGTGEGVYIKAEAENLSDKSDILTALHLLDSRVGKTKQRNASDFSGDAVLRGYKAKTQKVWMNRDEEDEQGQYVCDIRVEVPLESLKDLLVSTG